MTPRNIKSRKGPEAKIQENIVDFLRMRRWVVKETHGNIYQSGLPDLYICHPEYGARWVEVKNKEAYSFTRAQREFFPQLSSCGIGVWILVAATQEEYLKLWGPANWWQYLEVHKIVSRPRAVQSTYTPKYPFKVPDGDKK